MMAATRTAWAIKWRGHFVGRMGGGPVPEFVAGNRFLLFETRREARDYVRDRYGYIRNRPDLRRPPHNWRMPAPVKVAIEIKECSSSIDREDT